MILFCGKNCYTYSIKSVMMTQIMTVPLVICDQIPDKIVQNSLIPCDMSCDLWVWPIRLRGISRTPPKRPLQHYCPRNPISTLICG